MIFSRPPLAAAILIVALVAHGPAVRAHAAGGVYVPLGPGFTDVGSHQIVRTVDDRVYVFAGQAQYSPTLVAYWTTAPGLPDDSAAFDGAARVDAPGSVVSVDAAYDGGQIVHVLVNTSIGEIRDYPFDARANRFLEGKRLAAGGPTVVGDYLGTAGVAGMVDRAGTLHVAYWSAGGHISYGAYAYDAASDSLSVREGPRQLDDGGPANHPVVAISPVDGSVTVAWISEATRPARIATRTRAGPERWSDIAVASWAPVWTSTNAGINIDQGPSLAIAPDGTLHLVYVEDWDESGEYGRVHHATNNGSGWVDRQVPSLYTHDPAVLVTERQELYVFGHGHPRSMGCRSMRDLCVVRRIGEGPLLFAAARGAESFDSSPSLRSAIAGGARPETVELLFFSAPSGDYSRATIYYGRLEHDAATRPGSEGGQHGGG